jgi:hypothetical protein
LLPAIVTVAMIVNAATDLRRKSDSRIRQQLLSEAPLGSSMEQVSYPDMLRTSVVVSWGFDEQGRLIDLWVSKSGDGL